MGKLRRLVMASLLVLGAGVVSAQVIEFESGGLVYQTQTRNGITIMFAQMPILVREFAVIQVAVSNGSKGTWDLRPDEFLFRRPDGSEIRAKPARDVVQEFVAHGSPSDVVKLVTAYERGLYGFNRVKFNSGYEARREAALAYATSSKLKAASAASAIAFVPVKLKPGDSSDGAVFYANAGKPLGQGKLVLEAFNTVFEFNVAPLPAPGPGQ